jgi:hypothetical protein
MAISSLFGPTPAELILAQQKEARQEQLLRNQQIAQQGAEFGPFRGLYQAGLRMGEVGSQAIAQSLFPQQMDPRLQEATAIQSVITKFGDKDLTDPKVLTQVSQEFSKLGMTKQAVLTATEAKKFSLQEEELGIKRAKAGREARGELREIAEAERKELEFYTKNPDQTSVALQTLAEQLRIDPTNAAVLDKYNKIAAAGTTGAMKQTAEIEKERLDADRVKSIIAKNNAELGKIKKDNFDAGTRWNFERQAAIDLLASYNYKPGDKLKGADQLNAELLNAQEKAMREVWQGATVPTPRTTPTPTPRPAAAQSAPGVIDFNSLPK